MALFESQDNKKARRQMAIRMGKKKVQRYVSDCRRMGDKYHGMAKKAYALGNQKDCDIYLVREIRYGQQANRWDSFLLRMEDLGLRGQMADAMNGLVSGMQALTKELRAGATVKDINKTVQELNLTSERLTSAEEQFGAAMEGMDMEDMGPTAAESPEAEIPTEMREQIDRMKDELSDEVVVNEKTAGPVSSGGTKESGGKDDERIKDGLEKVRELRNKTS